MFGHIDTSRHWAAHLLEIRRLQERTGGFTEFVPLPFVHMEAPMYHKGAARRGPTSREAILMHAVSRLALHPLISNIQVSWVKMGRAGACAALRAGANDLGGTLMNESISRAAGTQHGQEMPPEAMDQLISSIGACHASARRYTGTRRRRGRGRHIAHPRSPRSWKRPRRAMHALQIPAPGFATGKARRGKARTGCRRRTDDFGDRPARHQSE